MTRQEWLDFGVNNGIIDIEECEQINFENAYQEWFKMKLTFVKPQSMDRVEVTYKRHYAGSDFVKKNVSQISDDDIIKFLLTLCLSACKSYRELSRIMQIMKGVLVFMKDINKGGAKLHDWEKIKRNLPLDKLDNGYKKEYAVSRKDVELLLHKVVNEKVYFEKQSACLCLCMNFFLGLRVGELSALEFSDFDLERGIVRVWKTESKYYNRDEDGQKIGTMVYRVVDSTKTVYSVREIPLLPEVRYLYELIRKHHKDMGYDSTYLSYDGKQTVLVRSLDRTLRKLLELCEIRYFSTHNIRRTFATVMHHNGVPTRVVSDLMGHSEIGTTENCYILSYDNAYGDYFNYMRKAINYSI